MADDCSSASTGSAADNDDAAGAMTVSAKAGSALTAGGGASAEPGDSLRVLSVSTVRPGLSRSPQFPPSRSHPLWDTGHAAASPYRPLGGGGRGDRRDGKNVGRG